MDRLENRKDKLIGKIKETVGEMTDQEDLEFQGKLQTMKAEIGDKVGNLKEEVMEIANDFIDKIRDNK